MSRREVRARSASPSSRTLTYTCLLASWITMESTTAFIEINTRINIRLQEYCRHHPTFRSTLDYDSPRLIVRVRVATPRRFRACLFQSNPSPPTIADVSEEVVTCAGPRGIETAKTESDARRSGFELTSRGHHRTLLPLRAFAEWVLAFASRPPPPPTRVRITRQTPPGYRSLRA